MSGSRKVYIAYREHDQIYIGEPEIDPADGVLKPGRRQGWAINDGTLTEMRLEGVDHFAIWVHDTGEIYLADRASWNTPAVSYPIDWSRKTGARGGKGSQQRVLRITNADGTGNFKIKTGTISVR